ncbi:vancomycin resistance protein YoaR [Caldicoprobacter guelmensis]|uniref:VanW family protein n=1 Tax=Caldicoprobacter guelmensis TaxID=1170224 RepID=UPI00195B5E30|nr:VanW family protein [Caldicoprobacter guelmensis]MBM7581639.1 vancomycin resistance protein YoaR [Caldicoprobacter guelmensis]
MEEANLNAMEVAKAGSKKGNLRRRSVIILVLSLSIVVVAFFIGYGVKKIEDYRKWIQHMKDVVEVPTFYHGIWVDDVNLGGMTFEEASAILWQKANEKLEKIRFDLVYGDKRWTFTYRDINAHTDWDIKIVEAYEAGRKGTLEERYNRVKEIEASGLKFQTSLYYNLDKIKGDIEAIAKEISYDPVDAEIRFYPDRENKFEITEEKAGLFLDAEEVFNTIKQRMEKGEYGEIVLIPTEVAPKVTKAELQKLTYRIVQFSTSLEGSSADRKHNVRLALSKLNGYRLNPGEVLSFNKIVGPRTAKGGFMPAPVIMPDKSMQDDYGGGVCQASSTLYNAALRANLEIVERHHHSFPVAYLPAGLDATVSYGGADLKIKNNRETPVFIRTFSSGDNVYVEIYGEPFPNNGYIECTSVVKEVIPAPQPKQILDKEGKYVKQPGGQYEYVKSRNGYKVTTYQTYYENGKKVWTKVIANDYYRPIQGIIYYRPKAEEQ